MTTGVGGGMGAGAGTVVGFLLNTNSLELTSSVDWLVITFETVNSFLFSVIFGYPKGNQLLGLLRS